MSTRREFLQQGAALPVVAATAASQLREWPMKVALYSVTFSGVWYDGLPLRVPEFLRKAKSLGYDAVELGGKRPHLSPLDYDEKACYETRKQAEAQGLEIVLSAYNNFMSPVPERRESEMLTVRALIRMAKYLGASHLRVFGGWRGITLDKNGFATYDEVRRADNAFPNVTPEQKWRWCKQCLQECVREAERQGVNLALQNHEPVMDGYENVIRMVREIGSEHLKIALSCDLLTSQTEDDVRKAVQAASGLIVHSHIGGEFDRASDGSVKKRLFDESRGIYFKRLNERNLPSFLSALAKSGFDGFLSYELCHPFIRTDGTRYTLQDAEEQAGLALEYIRAAMPA